MTDCIEIMYIFFINLILISAGKIHQYNIYQTKWLNEFFTSFVESNHYAGANIGMMHEGKLKYIHSYETTQNRQTIHPGTIFPISSLSKSLTAVGIMKLYEMELLQLDSTVFGPTGILDMISINQNDPRITDIKVKNLLQHSSGWDHSRPPLYDPMLNSLYQARHNNVTNIAKEIGVKTLATMDIIQYVLMQPLDFTPGTVYRYSNFGYCVLGRIIEILSGETYKDFITNKILIPLGMWHTQINYKQSTNNNMLFDHPSHLSPGLHFDDGYISLDEIAINHIHDVVSPNILDATLGWYSNIYDLMRFISAIDGTGKIQILQKETIQLMLQKPPPPMSQHIDQWFANGFYVHNSGIFWGENDPHDNNLLLWHSGIENLKSKVRQSQNKPFNLCWVIYLHGHQHKHLRHTLGAVLSSENVTWLTHDYFIDDLSDSHMLKNKILKVKVSEKHIPAYLNALDNFNFTPIWINVYNFQQGTFFSLIGEQKSTKDYSPKIIKYGLSRVQLADLQRDMALDGYTLTFLAGYTSYYHGYNIKYLAIFSHTDFKTYVGYEIPFKDYLVHLEDYKRNYFAIMVQNTIEYAREHYVSFIMHPALTLKEKTDTYHNLSLNELEKTIKKNSLHGQHLHYLDAYSDNSKLKFSAIFTKHQSKQWIIRNLMTREDIKKEIRVMGNKDYTPYLLVGYEIDEKLFFTIGWIKS